MTDRRAWLAQAAAWTVGGLTGCDRLARDVGVPSSDRADAVASLVLPPCRWVGQQPSRGHRVRAAKSGSVPAPAVRRRADVLVVGAGVAGLAAARALQQAGIDDLVVLELEPVAGGNSRGHVMGGMACPLGAHYVPVPGEHAREVQALLSEFGLARWAHGRWQYDERHLCHSPQERLFIDGAWHEGLLPPAEPGSRTQRQYRLFGQAVARAQRDLGFAMPTLRAAWTPAHARLDARLFVDWLSAEGLDEPRLLAHLDYCCRDDYGAGIRTVSAWAGLHYFASRHGFAVPGDESVEREPVLTWPQGNAWLCERMSASLGARVLTDRAVLGLTIGRHGVDVRVQVEQDGGVEQWAARQVVLAVPLFVAARIWVNPPAALTQAAAQMQRAPWLVANLQLDGALLERIGAPPSWDNVIAGSAGLGYVDAMHQSLRPHAGPTVLSAYWALPAQDRASLRDAQPPVWARRVLNDLSGVHPDLPQRVQAIDLARWGHAMAVPTPGLRGSRNLAVLQDLSLSQSAGDRVRVAHADLAGYSVFEEAYTRGWLCGRSVAGALRR